MNLLKICSLIIFYFLSRAALSAPCEIYKGYQTTEKLCWNDSIKGWLPEKCVDQKKCAALQFFSEKQTVPAHPPGKGGQNPAALKCHHLKLDVIVLRDPQNNEQSFCVFKDKSLVDANAVEGHVK